MIDRVTIQQIMDSANIIDIVKEFVTLHKAGSNYKGLCPFHNEKTPSFVVSPAKQICKCYGCGKGGNVIHFLMEIEQLSYPEAIKWLGKKYGIDVKDRELTDEQKSQQSIRESLFIVNEWASKYFINALHNSPDGISIALSYFRNRGLRDDIIHKFQLGYSPENREALSSSAIQNGFKKDFLVKTGLSFETEQHKLLDRYHGRIIFPIHTVSGKIVAFGGRILTNNKNVGKYINSPESEIYNKSQELYGLWLSKKSIVQNNHCYLVEGYMDVIALHQTGIENVVASSGTSLTEGQIRLIHRFTDNITVLFDGDSAGIHASIRSIDLLLKEGLKIKVVTLPNNDDPDSFTKNHNTKEVKEYLINHAQDFIDYKIKTLLVNIENDPAKKAEVIDSIIQSISVIPSGLMRQDYAHQFANILNTQEDLILSEITKKRRSDTSELSPNKNHNSSLPKEETAKQTTIQDSFTSKLEKIEYLIACEIIKFGHYPIFEEDGNTIRVFDYIHSELSNDNIQMHTPLYLKIYQEACIASQEEKWNSLSFFVNHPNETISLFSAKITTEKGDLCKKNKEQYGKEELHLPKRIPHLLNDYKIIIVQSNLEELKKDLNKAYENKDMNKCLKLMQKIKELNSIHKIVGQETSRIIN